MGVSMKKAILVIDMPMNCYECCLNNYHFCYVTDDSIEECLNSEYKPNWCPLKPLPIEKHLPDDVTDDYGWGHADGWNDCIEEIVGQE